MNAILNAFLETSVKCLQNAALKALRKALFER